MARRAPYSAGPRHSCRFVSLSGSFYRGSRGHASALGPADVYGRHSNGGNGGTVTITAAGSAPWLVPTIMTRGGDADFASGGVGTGGTGGTVTLDLQEGPMILGGGVGVQTVVADISTARPPLRDQVDRTDLPVPPQYIGDRLPPPPPFDKYYSVAASARAAGRKEPLRSAGFQLGFWRGILTSGGTGGAGLADAASNVNGGAGGAIGAIGLTVGALGAIRFKDVDLITGADVGQGLLVQRGNGQTHSRMGNSTMGTGTRRITARYAHRRVGIGGCP
ncbi:MAG: hypothetical protein ACREXX_23670 [Gammaproteobacteria bacterium]